MQKHYYKILSIVLTVISLILSIVLICKKVYAFKIESKNNDINSKIASEIDYLDSTIIEAMNKLNNITIVRYKIYTKSIKNPDSKEGSSSSNEKNGEEKKEEKQEKALSNADSTGDEKAQNEIKDTNKISVSQMMANNSLTETKEENINWDEITYIYENIYSVWPTIELDLKTLGMQEELANKFNIDLNGVAQSINSKDKKSALVNFYNLYSQLPVYLAAVSNDYYLVTIYECKSEILNSYVLAEDDNKWKEMSESVAKAKGKLKNLIADFDEESFEKINTEKTYAIVNDLENSIVLNDKNIFYMQYKNAIQSLETISQ